MRIVLHGVGHRFPGSSWLFRAVNTRFDAGCSYAITGPSGSGKSTLLGLVAGWQAPAEGSIDKVGVGKTSRVFQNPHGMPRRTALDHVALPALAAGSSRAEAECVAGELLHRFALDHRADSEFRALSGGEAQRLMFARAIASRPHLLLIDEPTAQLDVTSSRRVNAVISELRAEGRIVLVATHDVETVESCDHRLELTAFAENAELECVS